MRCMCVASPERGLASTAHGMVGEFTAAGGQLCRPEVMRSGGVGRWCARR
jgi:hypothetical protein